MNTINIKLYDLLRKDLKLPEDKAKEFVQAIDEVVQEEIKSSGTEFKSIVKDDFSRIELKLKDDFSKVELKIEQTKNDTVKWLFGFWITLVVLILTNFFLKK